MARADLSGIKNEIQTILEGANTTTGAPIDLSDSLSVRVQKVLQINVEKIPIQPSFFPCITMFFDSKSVEGQDMAGSMLNARMNALIDLKIVGIIWNDDMNTANFQYKDLADNQCEQLMENIEQVLRKDPSLNSKVIWSRTESVTYHNYPVSEDAHMRAGVLTFKMRAMY